LQRFYPRSAANIKDAAVDLFEIPLNYIGLSLAGKPESVMMVLPKHLLVTDAGHYLYPDT